MINAKSSCVNLIIDNCVDIDKKQRGKLLFSVHGVYHHQAGLFPSSFRRRLLLHSIVWVNS